MDPSNIISAAANIATIVLNVLGDFDANADKAAAHAPDPQETYPTGDLEWIGDGVGYQPGYGGYVYAYNVSSTPTNVTFTYNTSTYCNTNIITVDPGATSDLTPYIQQFSNGSVTVAPSQTDTDDTDTPSGQRFASFVVRGLGLGVVATIFPDVNLSVSGGSNPSLTFTAQSSIQSGSFTGTIANGDLSATVQGQFNSDNTQSSGVQTFPLPSFLDLDGPIDQLQVDLWLTTDPTIPVPKRAAKTFKGRPERKRKRKVS
jgi:hypothetical protein